MDIVDEESNDSDVVNSSRMKRSRESIDAAAMTEAEECQPAPNEPPLRPALSGLSGLSLSSGIIPASLNKTDIDIKSTLQAIVDHQISGLRRAKKIEDGDERAIIDRLRTNNCSPEKITSQVCAELLASINFRHDAPNASSKRMGGHGWSASHINDHMKRYLESKMAMMMSCIRSDDAITQSSENLWRESLQKAKSRTEMIGVSYGGEGLEEV